MKRIIMVFAALVSMAASEIKAQGIEFVHDKSFQEILDMARAQNKLVFMDCYTSWCGPCKRMAATTFPDQGVGIFFNERFISCKFDMEKDEGVTLAGKFGVRAYPTLLWLDADGNVKHKIVGALDPAGLIENGRKAVDPTPGILAGMRKQYTDGKRDPAFLADYMTTLQSAQEPYDEIFKEYMTKATPKDLSEEKQAKAVFTLTTHIKSAGLDYLVKNKDYYRGIMGVDVYDSRINQIAYKAVIEAPKANNPALFNEAIELVKSIKATDGQERIYKLNMEYYSRMNDWENYDKSAGPYIKKYASKNATVLNDIAWAYYINVNDEALLAKALKWSYQAVTLENKYSNNLTYAYLRYKLNDLDEAEKACDYAILRAKEENVLPSSASFLKETIQKTKAKQQ